MHANGGMLGQTFCQIPNHSIPKFSGLSQLVGNGLHHYPRRTLDTISDWRKDTRVGYLRVLIRKKIAQYFHWKTSHEWEQLPLDLVSLLENQLFMEAASEEEYVNQETLNNRLEILIQRKIDSVSTSQRVANNPYSSLLPTSGLTQYCNSNASAPLFNHFSDASTENGTVIANNTGQFDFLEGLLPNSYKQGVASKVAFDGENLPSSACVRQVADEVVYSPEQTSTITTLSSGDGFSDVGSFHGGPVFSQGDLPCRSETSFAGHFQRQNFDHGELSLMELKGCVGDNYNIHPMVLPSTQEEKLEFSYSKLQISQDVPQTIPEVSNILRSMDYSILSLTLENLLQSQLQISQLNEQPLHEPYVQFDRLSEAEALSPFIEQTKCRSSMGDQYACKQPKLPSEQSQGVQVASESSALLNSSKGTVCNANSSELLRFSIEHKILLAYLNHNSSMLSLGNKQVSFVNYLHSTVCNDHMCICQHFYSLLSHFSDCQYADCHICGPVRHLAVNGKIHQEFKNAKNGLSRDFNDGDSGGHSSGSSENMLPPLKRLKVEYPLGPFSSENCVLTPLKLQTCEPGRLLSLQQQPESPVFMNSEVNMTLLANSMKDSASISVVGNNVLNGFSRLIVGSAPTPEELIVRREEEKMDLRSVGESAENVKDDSECLLPDNFPRLNVESVLTSEELIFSQEEEEMDHRSVGESSENVKDDSECLLPDNFFRLNAESEPNPEELIVSCEQEMDLISVSERADNLKDDSKRLRFNTVLKLSEELGAGCKEEEVQLSTKLDLAKPDIETEFVAANADCEKEIKSETPKIRGVSLTEIFTVEQIREHISSLRWWIDQSTAKEDKGHKMIPTVSDNKCQLCAADKLSLAPTPIYCSFCGARIKRSVIYYSTPEENGMRHCFCTSCYKARGGSITFYGIAISKAELDKKKNDEETEESWVQCDKCQGWQHQICALFNDKRDMEGKAEYICPKCCLKELESGERVPLSRSAVFSAKDLPSTILSNHIEQRLYRRLWQERHKAKVSGKNFDENPGAEDLVVRVVLSVDKQLKVTQQFLDIFHDKNYPAEFPYRSKVILLFQKIEGVDVCLFGMYVQEFGSECGYPNQRCVYISYLDSVKYFRPEAEAAAGEALRTIVYHEILIGYLEYCKKRGFATCYLWACPPVKGEDFILYCHPENQKTPKSDKLRQWYHSMLRKAAKQKIVVDYTNLYDHFFVSTGPYYSKVTAARLPYFDGDYWSGAAENVIKNIEQENGEDSRRKVKKVVTKRTLKTMGHTNPSDGATKDAFLMKKLGQTILSNKEDFIIVHLQFVCTHCREVILSGWRWFCSQCKNFYLCERCHDAEQNLNGGNTHSLNSREKHLLTKVMVDDVPSDTEDKDVILDIGLFENRHAFLSFCQKNHYQFDTLRRAKHSSMMILHHLRNPTVLIAGTTCSICFKDTLIDQCWLCEICPKFDVCSACYHKEGGSLHVHKLTPRSSAAINGAARKAVPQKPSTRELLDVLQHASQCRTTKTHPCLYPNCLLIKKLFRHASKCTVRVNGGCEQCKKAWLGLILHSRNCRESDCSVPRCKDLKKAELQAHQSENQ